jgi:tyrosine-protein phosphatase YwqE
MFSLFRKNKSEEKSGPYFPIQTDIHSHILPGIDDGSPDLETSVSLVKGLMALGVKRSVATPHVISDMFRNTPETINAALTKLKAELKQQKIDFEVSAAAEYMMDASFFEMLQRKEKLLTIHDKIVLTEFSYATVPHSPQQMSFAIITEGYTPILAHPERYPYYYHDYKMYHELADLGFKLQLNLLSLLGYYGKEAARASAYMLKNDLISYVGTDMHHDRHLEGLTTGFQKGMFRKHLGEKEWNVFS